MRFFRKAVRFAWINYQLSRHAAVLQRVRVGESVMVAGYGGLREDVIPFGYVMHPFGRLTGVNLIGMRRRGIKREAIHAVRAAYVALFKGEGRFADRIERGLPSSKKTNRPRKKKLVLKAIADRTNNRTKYEQQNQCCRAAEWPKQLTG